MQQSCFLAGITDSAAVNARCSNFDDYWAAVHTYDGTDKQRCHLMHFFVDSVLPAQSLMLCSERSAQFWTYTQAEMFLLPLDYVRHMVNYGPYILNFLAMWLHRVPHQVRELRVQFFVHEQQAQGAILEEKNRLMKRITGGESSAAMTFSSSFLGSLLSMRERVFKIMGSADRNVAKKGVSEWTYEADIDALTGIILDAKAYAVVPGRTKICTVDGSEELLFGGDSVSLYAEGVLRLATASTAYIADAKYIFPVGVSVVRAELQEGVQGDEAVAANDDAVGENDAPAEALLPAAVR